MFLVGRVPRSGPGAKATGYPLPANLASVEQLVRKDLAGVQDAVRIERGLDAFHECDRIGG
jgi:hypothetical protein